MENSATLAVGRCRRSSSLSDIGLCRVGKHRTVCTKTWVTLTLIVDRAVAVVIAATAILAVAAVAAGGAATADPAVAGVTAATDDPAVTAVTAVTAVFESLQRLQQIQW